MTENHTKWFLDSRFSLRFCAWENEDFGVVYNKTNGKTHLIDVLGISILSYLSASVSVTVSSIANELTEGSVHQDISFPEEYILETLFKLKQLELVIVS